MNYTIQTCYLSYTRRRMLLPTRTFQTEFIYTKSLEKFNKPKAVNDMKCRRRAIFLLNVGKGLLLCVLCLVVLSGGAGGSDCIIYIHGQEHRLIVLSDMFHSQAASQPDNATHQNFDLYTCTHIVTCVWVCEYIKRTLRDESLYAWLLSQCIQPQSN